MSVVRVPMHSRTKHKRGGVDATCRRGRDCARAKQQGRQPTGAHPLPPHTHLDAVESADKATKPLREVCTVLLEPGVRVDHLRRARGRVMRSGDARATMQTPSTAHAPPSRRAAAATMREQKRSTTPTAAPRADCLRAATPTAHPQRHAPRA